MQGEGRRAKLFAVISMIVLVLGAQTVWGQEYPNRPVTLVIPFGPGGGHDLTAQAITPVASKYLGQHMIVQHKPGGAGMIGSQQVAGAKPDGYTLLFAGIGPNCSLPAIQGRGFGPESLEGVCQVAGYSTLILSRPDAPFKDIREMVKYAKVNPDKLIFANSGTLGATDIAIRLVMKEAGMTAKNVPYDGGGPSVMATLGGHADMTGATPFLAQPYIKSGKLMPLAVLDHNRHPEYPDLPTAKEQGVDVVYIQWIAVAAPKGTPRPIIQKLSEAFKSMIEDDSTKERARRMGVETRYIGTKEFTDAWIAEFENFKQHSRVFK